MGLEVVELKCKSCGAQLFMDPANRSSYITCQACGTQNVVSDDAKLSLLNRAHYFLEHEEINNAKKVIDTLHFYFPGHVEVRDVENALAKKLNQMGLRVLNDKLTKRAFSQVDVGGLIKSLTDAKKYENDTAQIPTLFRAWLDAQPNEYFQSAAPGMPEDALGCGAYCKSRADYINGSLQSQALQNEIDGCTRIEEWFKQQAIVNRQYKTHKKVQAILSVLAVAISVFLTYKMNDIVKPAEDRVGFILMTWSVAIIALWILRSIFRTVRSGTARKASELRMEAARNPLMPLFQTEEDVVKGTELRRQQFSELSRTLPEQKQRMETAYSTLIANLMGGQEASAE